MTTCPHCVRLWARHGQAEAGLPHPECLAPSHDAAATIEVGRGPVTAFGWLHSAGPPVAFACGPAPTTSGWDRLDATATDPDRQRAGTKAIAELLERQAAHLRPRAPTRFCVPGGGTAPQWCVRARSIVDGRPVLLPAARLRLASQTSAAGPGTGDSTGMAVAQTGRRAVRSGLLEAVERAGVAVLSADGPAWRAAPHDDPFAAALTGQGWAVDVVGLQWAGFAVAVCVASGEHSLGGAAARTTVDGAVTAAVAEAYMKSTALLGDRAVSAMTARVATRELWPGLPEPAARPEADPVEVLRWSGLDAVAVDRGNPLLDAIGWCAVQVVLPDAPAGTGPLLTELLR